MTAKTVTRQNYSSITESRPSIIDDFCMKSVFSYLSRLRKGHLLVSLPDGSRRSFGDNKSPFKASIIVNNYRFFRRVLLGGDIGFGESYVAGEWDTSNLTDCLRVFAENISVANDREYMTGRAMRLINRCRHFLRRNTLAGSKANIEYHYDLGNDFYELFLDQSKMYSCAIFRSPDESLEQAQMNKVHALIAKARVKKTDHLLEIGSGWGTVAITAAKTTGCKVTTITLSNEQYAYVKHRILEEGLEGQVDVLLKDYREMEGEFDKIISVEMLEAVGHEHFGTYFEALDKLLKPNGLAVIQVITIPDQRYDDYRRSTDWIQKYIFPGAVVPSLTALSNAITRHSRFHVDDLQNIGIHYARTLREWRDAFHAGMDEVRLLGFDEKFCRMWDYYLCYCEAGYAARELNNLQLVLTRTNNQNLPVYTA